VARAASASAGNCTTGSPRCRPGSRVAATAKQAKRDLRLKLQRRNTATGFGVALSPESTVAELAEARIEDVRLRTDLAAGTKDLYRRELNSLVLPTFQTFRLREVDSGSRSANRSL
jgi:hypothetical protein